MQIHVTPPAVVRCQVEHRVHSLHRGSRYARLAQIGLAKLQRVVAEMFAQVFEPATRQIVHHARLRPSCEQLVHQR